MPTRHPLTTNLGLLPLPPGDVDQCSASAHPVDGCADDSWMQAGHLLQFSNGRGMLGDVGQDQFSFVHVVSFFRGTSVGVLPL